MANSHQYKGRESFLRKANRDLRSMDESNFVAGKSIIRTSYFQWRVHKLIT